MLKGILSGLGVTAVILYACFHLVGYGAISCGPGVGLILAPLLLLSCLITAAVLRKSTSPIVAVAAKTVLVFTILSFLVILVLIFG